MYIYKSGVVYRFKCGSSNAAYFGKTKRHLKVRVSDTCFQSSAIKDHMLVFYHRVSLDDFSILAISGNNIVLELKDSLFIFSNNTVLNRTISSVPLCLFK